VNAFIFDEDPPDSIMATDCNAGGHCGLKNWKYNPLCDENQQVISAMVN
jgi:hypothetical protein